MNLLRPGEAEKQRARKLQVGAWIQGIVDSDALHGRTQGDFAVVGPGMENIVQKVAPAMKQRGFDVYQGGGNVFFVRYKNGEPIVIHTRSLAQRVVRPKFP